VISEMSEELHTTFNDFDSLKPKLQLFSNPKDIEVTQRIFDLQMKCHLQLDPFFFQLKKESPGDFWKMLSQEKFPKL
jgi:hypothetical protein